MAEQAANVEVQQTGQEQTVVQTEPEIQADVQEETGNEEIARLKAELAKQKAAIDKATKEAAGYKKELRARQSAEEIAAEEKRIADEERNQELESLRKRFAVAEIGKKVMGLGADDATSTKIAELLYGAEDVENALTEIQKVWSAREKALRLEFGKITPPGGGNENAAELAAINMAREIGKSKAETNKTAQEAMKAYMR